MSDFEVVDAEIDPAVLRRWEVERLAERLYVAAYGGFWSLTEAETTVAGAPSLSATFAIAEDFITYRDSRREQVKR